MADHFVHGRLRLFVRQSTLARNGDGRDRARINEFLDARAPRRVEQVLRPVHIRFVDFPWIAGPEPVIRGDVKNALHAVHRAIQRRAIPQIPCEAIRVQPFERAEIAGRAHQHPHVLPASCQCAGDVAAEKACRSGDQRFHNTRNLPSEEIKSVFAGGGGINVEPPPACPFVGGSLGAFRSGLPPMCPPNCHFSIVQVSPNWRFAPSTGVVSNPTCIMQLAQRGSFPGP